MWLLPTKVDKLIELLLLEHVHILSMPSPDLFLSVLHLLRVYAAQGLLLSDHTSIYGG